MKNFISAGSNVAATAPAIVASGAGVQIGSLSSVANGVAASGADVVLTTTGVFELSKASTDDVSIGKSLYWDDTTKVVTVDGDSGANLFVGIAISVVSNRSSSVRARLSV